MAYAGPQYYPLLSTNVGYHPFKGSLLPANNKATLDKTKKNISSSRRLSFLFETDINLSIFKGK